MLLVLARVPPVPPKIKAAGRNDCDSVALGHRARRLKCLLAKPSGAAHVVNLIYSLEPAGTEWPVALLWGNRPSGLPMRCLRCRRPQETARGRPSGHSNCQRKNAAGNAARAVQVFESRAPSGFHAVPGRRAHSSTDSQTLASWWRAFARSRIFLLHVLYIYTFVCITRT